jgi:hypothetical protein
MKSPWLWIAGIVIAIWVFSDASKKNKAQPLPYTHPQSVNLPPGNVYSSPTFMGYTCTADCSGHEAGYEWAEENGIDDPDDCDGNSDSFIEGCQAYAEEQQALLGEGTGDE